jgi:purine-binding chemotaxis protein CheW
MADAVLAAGGEDEEGRDPNQYLTFGLEGEVFAVSVHQVREVLDLQRVSRIANAPPLLLGMIDVRGASIPVIDLKRKLGLPGGGEGTEHSRIVVLEVEADGRPLVVGTVTDSVYEVRHLPAEAIDRPPQFGQRWDSSFMRGLARREGEFVTLLDLGRLFGAAELDLLGLAPG